MKGRIKKLSAIALTATMLAASLCGCDRGEDLDYLTTVDNPLISSSGNLVDGEGNITTPDDLGYTGDDVDFDLTSPGTPTFDDVGLVHSTDAPVTVGDGDTGGSYVYNGVPVVEDMQVPESNLPEETLPDLNSVVDTIPAATDAPTGEDTTPTNDSEGTVVPESVKLPNTGIFLEDD